MRRHIEAGFIRGLIEVKAEGLLELLELFFWLDGTSSTILLAGWH